MSLALVHYSCNLCGQEKEKILFERAVLAGSNVVVCMNCGLIYVNPRPSDKALNELYNENYYKGNGFDGTADYVADAIRSPFEQKTSAHFDVAVISDFVPSGGYLLDIGCGLGHLMKLAHARGYHVEGYDISPFAVEFVKKQGFHVYHSFGSIPSERFDAVTIVETLEHANDPMAIIKEAFRVLKKGGVLYIWSENFDGFVENILRRRKDRRFGYASTVGHINFFTTKVIKSYFLKIGFRSFITFDSDLYFRKNSQLYRFLYKLRLMRPKGVEDKVTTSYGRFIWLGGRRLVRFYRRLQGIPCNHFPIAVK